MYAVNLDWRWSDAACWVLTRAHDPQGVGGNLLFELAMHQDKAHRPYAWVYILIAASPAAQEWALAAFAEWMVYDDNMPKLLRHWCADAERDALLDRW